MGDAHSKEDIKKHVKTYIAIFIALLIGTVLTVGAAFVDLGHTFNIALALLIASVKAFLVAGFFMHLLSEKKTIYAILVCTVVFFAGLMALTIISHYDVPVLVK
jgi:cytochrome c oxidase subunit IV